jgi:hypothetical protein
MPALSRSRNEKKNSNLLLIGVLVVFGILIAAQAYQKSQSAVVPEKMKGTWASPAPKMKDRYLQFTDRLVIFGTGNGRKAVHDILEIDSQSAEKGRTLYTFHYKDAEGVRWTLGLYHSGRSGGTIQFRYRPEIWHRVVPEVKARAF